MISSRNIYRILSFPPACFSRILVISIVPLGHKYLFILSYGQCLYVITMSVRVENHETRPLLQRDFCPIAFDGFPEMWEYLIKVHLDCKDYKKMIRRKKKMCY